VSRLDRFDHDNAKRISQIVWRPDEQTSSWLVSRTVLIKSLRDQRIHLR